MVDSVPSPIYTIGHSTRSIDELVSVLRHYGIEQVVDVRTVPRSRKNPQFNRDELEHVLPKTGIGYAHMKDLGGLRKPLKDSPNMGWENEGFRGFADYMQTPEFDAALSRLTEAAVRIPTAIMCAELLPWKCHRSLIADALLARGFEVIEIIGESDCRTHEMTSFAHVADSRITYPAVGTLD